MPVPYTLRIVFSGPCAFVPNRLVGSADPVTSWSVLIPKLKNGRRIIRPLVDGSTKEVRIPPHFPAVVFPVRALVGGNKPPDIFFRRPQGEEFAVAFLDAERVTLHFPDQNRSGRSLQPLLDPLPVNRRPDLTARRSSLRWMIEMKDLLKGAGEVRTGDLFASGRPQEGSLAGHIILDDGVLYTHSFAEPGGRISLWDFPGPEDTTTQEPRPVAYTVALEVEEVEGPVQLRFEKPSGLEPIVRSLSLAPDPRHPDLEILLSNREFEEVVGFGDVIPEEDDTDDDFEIHYLLSAKAETPGRRLPRLRGIIESSGLGGHRITCGTSLFEGFDQAFQDTLDALQSSQSASLNEEQEL